MEQRYEKSSGRVVAPLSTTEKAFYEFYQEDLNASGNRVTLVLWRGELKRFDPTHYLKIVEGSCK